MQIQNFKSFNPEGTTCTTQANCDAARSNANKYDMKFAEDLGNFWMETANHLSMLYCPEIHWQRK